MPVTSVTPVDGQLAFTEGVHIGYRAWLRSGATPAYEFGFGLQYTDFELSGIETSSTDAGLDVAITVTNVGERAGGQGSGAGLPEPR